MAACSLLCRMVAFAGPLEYARVQRMAFFKRRISGEPQSKELSGLFVRITLQQLIPVQEPGIHTRTHARTHTQTHKHGQGQTLMLQYVAPHRSMRRFMARGQHIQADDKVWSFAHMCVQMRQSALQPCSPLPSFVH